MPPEPGTTKAILETLLKPFTAILNPIAERIGNRLKRKPRLYFNIHPVGSIWCYAWNGAKPMMQVRFDADITNDGGWQALPPTIALQIFVSRFFSSRCAQSNVVGMYLAPALNSPCKFTKEIHK